MVRKCFYSFHYQPDSYRVSKVRNIGALENKPVSDNDWETVTGGGDAAIKKWIKDQIRGRSCTIILAGSKTADRKWINYEIKESWSKGMGIVVIFIHNIKDHFEEQSVKGSNPLDYIKVGSSNTSLSKIAKAYNPPQTTSKGVYKYVSDNIEDWIEEAIEIRNDH